MVLNSQAAVIEGFAAVETELALTEEDGVYGAGGNSFEREI
jgi:hypothetical protein